MKKTKKSIVKGAVKHMMDESMKHEMNPADKKQDMAECKGCGKNKKNCIC